MISILESVASSLVDSGIPAKAINSALATIVDRETNRKLSVAENRLRCQGRRTKDELAEYVGYVVAEKTRDYRTFVDPNDYPPVVPTHDGKWEAKREWTSEEILMREG